MNQREKRLSNSLEGKIPIQNICNRLKPTKIQLHKCMMVESWLGSSSSCAKNLVTLADHKCIWIKSVLWPLKWLILEIVICIDKILSSYSFCILGWPVHIWNTLVQFLAWHFEEQWQPQNFNVERAYDTQVFRSICNLLEEILVKGKIDEASMSKC